MTDLIGKRKRHRHSSLKYGEDYQMLYERKRENRKDYVPISDTHIDAA